MDKGTVLTHMLKTKGTASLLGGEVSASVINQDKYMSPLCSIAQETDGDEADSTLSFDDAFSDDVKYVTLVGPEGSGKTTSLEKLVVDWAKKKHLQKFSFLFLFRIKELNSLNSPLSLQSLMLHHHGHITPDTIALIVQRPEDVLFVFDDVHLCKESLDPSIHTLCSDPSQTASLSCLVASLLHGSLLKGAPFILATRSTERLNFLHATEVTVLGFLKPQREAFFNRFFSDPAVAHKAVIHMENTLGFYDFCTSPRFCWTVCCIYKSVMDAGGKLPETLSQLFIEILVCLLQTLSLSPACNRQLVLAVGNMTSHCLLEQCLSCTREEMDSFGFQQLLTAASVFLQVEDDQSDRFTFHSQLMQEFILAVSFFLDSAKSEGVEKMLEKYKSHTEFLGGFLSALSEPAQRRQLEALLGEFNSDQMTDFKCWLKSSSEKTLKGFHKEKHHHCFNLLYQAQNESLVKEIITPSARIGISYGDLNLQQCIPLNYVVKCLGEMQNLNLYNTSNLTEEQAEALAPAMSLSHEIMLADSTLSMGAVPHLASALRRGLTKGLNLSRTRLGDEKFKILCTGLSSCALQTLNLVICSLTEESCEHLASVLTSATSQLGMLDLTHNEIGDRGFIKLSKALDSSHCKLQDLRLEGCELTAESMKALSRAVISGQSQLKRINLKLNTIGLTGVEALCKSLQHPQCKLQSLNLFDCELTGECCRHFMEALMSQHCSLSELDLSVNDLDQEGALLLCQALSHPGCPMEKLGLQRCSLTQPVFQKLGSVLRSGTSLLKSLSVGLHDVGDIGVKHLWDAVAHPNCQLEELDVEMTNLTDACVKDMCAAIKASKTLKRLELKNNSLTDASVPALVQVMQQSQNMEEMNVQYNDFSEDVFDMLEECGKIRY